MRGTREQWAKRVREWRRSGLSAKEFAATAGVKRGTLTHWAWRLGKESREAARSEAPERPAAAGDIFAIVPRRCDAAFELELCGGRRLRIPEEFSAEALGRLLSVLESGR